MIISATVNISVVHIPQYRFEIAVDVVQSEVVDKITKAWKSSHQPSNCSRSVYQIECHSDNLQRQISQTHYFSDEIFH